MSDPSPLDRKPTRLSTALVLAVTLLSVAALVTAVGQGRRVLFGAVGAGALAASLWALAHDRFRAVSAALTGLALPVVGASLLASVGYTLAAQIRVVVPPGTVFLVLGATVAVFGAAASVGDVLGRKSLVRAHGVGLRMTVVVSLALAVAVALRFAPVARELGATLSTALSVLLDPVAGRVHLAVWLTLAMAAVYGARAALRALPVAELLGDTLDDDQWTAVARADTVVQWLAPVLMVATTAAFVFELVGGTYADLSASLSGFLGPLTTAGALRWLLLVVACGSAIAVVGTWAVRRGYRASGSEVATELTPYAAGATLSIAAVTASESLLSVLREQVAVRLPAAARPRFEELADVLVDFYGGALLALAVVFAVTIVALALLLVLYLIVGFGLVPDRGTGAALASGGVFTTAAFAATLGASLPLALCGIVASILVWDAGEFGLTLGEELGVGTATARTELVHAGGTALVGVCVAGLALALSELVAGLGHGSVPIVPALAGALVGAVFLVVASR